MTFSGKVAIVTGASTGLGAALARQLADAGARVGLLALPGPELEAVAEAIRARGGTALAVAADVADRDAHHLAVEQLAQALGPVDLLILNAGIAAHVSAPDFSAEGFERLVRVNLLGVAHGLEAVLPAMTRRGHGQIVAISSLSSLRARAFVAGYSATKAAVAALVEGLRVELRARRLDVHLTVVRPGLVRTPMTDWIKSPNLLMDPERAAAIILRGVARRKPEISFPRLASWTMHLARLLPASLHDRLSAAAASRFLAAYAPTPPKPAPEETAPMPRSRSRLGLIALAAAATLGLAAAASTQAPAPQDPPAAARPPAGPTSTPRAHDPAAAVENGRFYLFTTGPGVSLHTSTDLVTWNRLGSVLDPPPAWTAETIPGSRNYYWAPDISFFNNRWHLYYSVSTFGRNRSAIGLATSPTLDPDSPDHRWTDQGVVFESNPDDDFNAIDPNVVLDPEGRPWLTFGSFWGGLMLLELDPDTGKPVDPDARPLPIARRSAHGDAVEAPFLVRHDGEYFLFSSFDFCCRGVRSTYNIRVARARDIKGPYLDRDGKPALEGGGTLLREGSDRWRGPGHSAVLHDPATSTDWLLYHAYDAENRGLPTLRVEALRWDEAGWPIATERAPQAP